MLATDPHQPHSVPNTFFYVHLHAPGFDVFGAAFPGVPHFMMGRTPHLAWGLTTGFIDNYDVYVESVSGTNVRRRDGWEPIDRRTLEINVRGEASRQFEIERTSHGPLLEPLAEQLGLSGAAEGGWRTALHWSFTDVPTSAGALAQLPLATTAEAFGELCSKMTSARWLTTSSVWMQRAACVASSQQRCPPGWCYRCGAMPGWDPAMRFERSRAQELVVEIDPASGQALTANEDTMGDGWPYPITLSGATAHGLTASRQPPW